MIGFCESLLIICGSLDRCTRMLGTVEGSDSDFVIRSAKLTIVLVMIWQEESKINQIDE